MLQHQVERTRKSWDQVASQLAAAGINTLTLDTRGFGESRGTRWSKLSRAELGKQWRGGTEDVDAALEFLRCSPEWTAR